MSIPFPPLSTPELLVYSSLLALAIYLIVTLFSGSGRNKESAHTTPALEEKVSQPNDGIQSHIYSAPPPARLSRKFALTTTSRRRLPTLPALRTGSFYCSSPRFSAPAGEQVVAAVQKAINAGDATAFRYSIEKEFRTDWDGLDGHVLHRIKLPGGRTVLHDAAMTKGALKLVKTICDRAPFLMCKRDESGETVWHIAARDEYVSKGLFDTLYDTRQLWKQRFEAADTPTLSVYGVEGSMNELSVHAVNIKNGNTPLHEAILCNNTSVAQKLFVADKEMCCKLNKENKSPMNLAIENGEATDDDALFKSMFEYAIRTDLWKSAIDAKRSILSKTGTQKEHRGWV